MSKFPEFVMATLQVRKAVKWAQVANSQMLVKAHGSQSLCSCLTGGTEGQGWKSIVAGFILKSFRSLLGSERLGTAAED